MTQRIRVLELVTGLAIGDAVGGAELFGVQLARHLDANEFDVAVVGLWRYGSQSELRWVERLRAEGLEAHLLGDPNSRLCHEFPRLVRGLRSVVDRSRPHVIHSHAERADVLNLIIHFLHSVHPVAIRTMHTDQQWQRSPWLGAVLTSLVFPWAFSEEVSISRATRDVLGRRPLARMLHKDSHVIYNGIETELLSFVPSRQSIDEVLQEVPGNVPCIGIVGRLTRQKGHRHFLDAAKIVLQEMPATFVIVGTGDLDAQLRLQAADLGINQAVHFVGSRPDVPEIMSHLDVLVSASLWEGMPTVLLEAMALGVPVVATDVSGSREIVRQGITGQLVPVGHPGRLAEAILEVLRDPLRAVGMAQRATLVAKDYTVQDAARRYAEVYRIALSSRRRCKTYSP